MDSQPMPPMTPQETYDLARGLSVDPSLPPEERQYYHNLCENMYQKIYQEQQQMQEYQRQRQQQQQQEYQRQQRQQQQQQQQRVIAGASDYHDHYVDLTSPVSAQMPSPPPAESSLNRKRSLGPTEYPEPKRVSAQPSPASSGSPPAQQWTLSSRQSNPRSIVDLTESDPPTPESTPERPQPQHQAFSDSFVDPFQDFDFAYRGGNVGLDPADAFNQDFMGRQELAAFMLEPAPPAGSYAFQSQQNGMSLPPFGGDISDSDEYGTISGLEADTIDKILENVKEHGEKPEDRAPTPAMMTCTLKEYQRIGLSWLLKMETGHYRGGILADEMGLGKTIQALALICANPPPDTLHKTTLIIAPVALMRQWEKEIDRHIAPGHKLKVHLYHGSGKNADFTSLRKFDVVLTTFGCLTSEYKQLKSSKESMLRDQERLGQIPQRKPKDRLALLGRDSMWYRIIIDEAHNIKNRKTQTSLACAELQGRHRLCLTGTPMMNSVEELYPLLRFLHMKHYEAWQHFNTEINKGIKSQQHETKKKAMNRVQIIIKSIMLRRQKDSKVDGQAVCTIPPKHMKDDVVKFTHDEHELYKALETKSQIQYSKYLQKDHHAPMNAIAVLTMLLRLRQACCHPHLIKDLSQPATDGIAEDDLLNRAKELNPDVVLRMLTYDSFECPICLEPDANPTIIIPCGHTVCGECVQKLIDPANRPQNNGNDEATVPRCPHCRGELKAKLITDYKHFCKVHCPERLDDDEDGPQDDEADDSDEDSDSEDDDDRDAPDADKKGNLAGFVVDDDEEDDYEVGETNDDDTGSVPDGETTSSNKKSKKRSKGKGKGKQRVKPKQTLAQLKKESLRNKAAKKRYLRRLDKTYVSSAKIDRTVELVKEIRREDPTEKTLIFSQFTSLLDLVEVPLHREKIRYQRYDGSMKMDDRADSVNAFTDDPNENVMLVSLKAGNAGLNLSKASRVIILDPFWNPFIEDQAVDRAHRMPQTREVHVYRLLIPETIEDRICQLQDTKRETVGKALDENDSKGLTRLNKRELKFLFGMH